MNEHTAAASNRWRAIGTMVIAALLALLTGGTTGVATARADDARDRMVNLPGGALHVVTDGTPSTRAVVLIHGLAGSTAWWDPVVPALSDRYVVRIDLLGHGKSDKPDSGYSMEEQASRVAAVLDDLGVRQAIVVGHSTGGYVATALAAQRRDLVTAIALVDTGSRLDAFTDNGPAGALLAVPSIGRLLWPILPDAAIRASLSSAFNDDVTIPPQIVADVRGMTYRSLTATSAASDTFLQQRQEPARLAELGLPVMVLFGTRDRRWPAASFQDYRAVPGVRLESLDCGHTPMLEEPGPTGALLHDFTAAH
ncbi:alpha/beta fold hydrolase [Nocardia sp. NPDC020380]|uniref:alpha/beta fold hydrolase n=1 Tax=Nocardia sp. NPDC020380 TaxID=3364309 RepID=UPI0037B75EF8